MEQDHTVDIYPLALEFLGDHYNKNDHMNKNSFFYSNMCLNLNGYKPSYKLDTDSIWITKINFLPVVLFCVLTIKTKR